MPRQVGVTPSPWWDLGLMRRGVPLQAGHEGLRDPAALGAPVTKATLDNTYGHASKAA